MENTRRQKTRKRLSILIICTMIMQLCMPASYGAVTYRTAETRKLITGFTDLPESVKNINVPLGADDATIKNLLTFPETVEATVIEEELTATQSNATASNADTASDSDAAKASDSNTYTADEEEDETADGVLVNDIEVLMDVPVTWELNTDPDKSVKDTFDAGQTPESYFGLDEEGNVNYAGASEEKMAAWVDMTGAYYTYTAVLPEKDEDGNPIVLAEGVEVPEIFVMVGVSNTMLMMAPVSYDIKSGKLTINNSNKSTYEYATITGISDANNITIDGVEVNLKISNLDIQIVQTSDLSSYIPAIKLTNGAKLNLTIADSNTLKGGPRSAGISVPQGCKLTVTEASTGFLKVTGGSYSAGIGADGNHLQTYEYVRTLGTVCIEGGTIEAYGTGPAAGIGGSSWGNMGSIEISGGEVTAEGGSGGYNNKIYPYYSGAGIGGGSMGYVESIIISGGDVTAIGGYTYSRGATTYPGAGIGTGDGGGVDEIHNIITCGTINLTGGNITAIGGNDNEVNAIGYGLKPNSDISDSKYVGTVTVGENAVLNLEGGSIHPLTNTNTQYNLDLTINDNSLTADLSGTLYVNDLEHGYVTTLKVPEYNQGKLNATFFSENVISGNKKITFQTRNNSWNFDIDFTAGQTSYSATSGKRYSYSIQINDSKITNTGSYDATIYVGSDNIKIASKLNVSQLYSGTLSGKFGSQQELSGSETIGVSANGNLWEIHESFDTSKDTCNVTVGKLYTYNIQVYDGRLDTVGTREITCNIGTDTVTGTLKVTEPYVGTFTGTIGNRSSLTGEQKMTLTDTATNYEWWYNFTPDSNSTQKLTGTIGKKLYPVYLWIYDADKIKDSTNSIDGFQLTVWQNGVGTSNLLNSDPSKDVVTLKSDNKLVRQGTGYGMITAYMPTSDKTNVEVKNATVYPDTSMKLDDQKIQASTTLNNLVMKIDTTVTPVTEMDLSYGDITIIEDGGTLKFTYYELNKTNNQTELKTATGQYYFNEYTIKQSDASPTTNTISITNTSQEVQLKLDGVNMTFEEGVNNHQGKAINIENAKVRLNLAGKNVIDCLNAGGMSTTSYNFVQNTGIRVNPASELTIDSDEGDGSIEIKNPSFYGVGIGGWSNFNADNTSGTGEGCGTIRIEGGNVTASGKRGAAIGSSYKCGKDNPGEIYISGGTVKATSIQVSGDDYSGAAIGASGYGYVPAIYISGGNIEATGVEYEAAIGNGSSSSGGADIQISGGTVKAIKSKPYGKSGCIDASDCKVTISGGTVILQQNSTGIYMNKTDTLNIIGGTIYALDTSGNVVQPRFSDGVTPKNSTGSAVYYTTADVKNLFDANADTSNVRSWPQQSSYGCEDMRTDQNGVLHLYLPEGAATNSSTVKLGINDMIYEGDITEKGPNILQKRVNLNIYNRGERESNSAILYTLADKGNVVTYIVRSNATNELTAIDIMTASDKKQYTSDGSEYQLYLEGLEPSTLYTLYVVAQDESDNYSLVNRGYVTTLAAQMAGTVSIEGTTQYGCTLTASYTSTQTNLGTITYTWYQDDSNIPLKTGSANTYTIGASTIGHKIRVEVSCTNYTGNLTEQTAAIEKRSIETGYSYSAITKDYTGEAVVLSISDVVVSETNDTSKKLTTGTDFTIGTDYSNNTEITQSGAAKASVTISGAGYYTGTMTIEFSIVPAAMTDAMYTITGTKLDGAEYYQSQVIVDPASGYSLWQIDGTNAAVQVTNITLSESTPQSGKDVTFFIKDRDSKIYYVLDNGSYGPKTLNFKIDLTAPTGTIKIGAKIWDSFMNTITFGKYHVDTNQVTITSSDTGSGKGIIYYLIASEEKDMDSLKAVTDGWNTYLDTSKPVLSVNSNQIIYAKLTDNAGNASYISSNGMIVDTSAPKVTDVAFKTDDATLKDTQADFSFKVDEESSYYYVVIKADHSEPSAASVIVTAGGTEAGGSAIADAVAAGKGNVSALVNGSAVVSHTVTGLLPNRSYKVYVVAQDDVSNISSSADGVLEHNTSIVGSAQVTTKQTALTVNKVPVLSGIYGTQVQNMTLVGGVVQDGGTAVTGTWSVTDANKTDIPAVGTETSYKVTFAPTDDTSYGTVDTTVVPAVSKKKVTVTADDKEKTYKSENPELTFTVPDGALVGSDEKTALNVSLSTAATKDSLVGNNYTIIGEANSTNYDVTVTPGTLKITQATGTLTITTKEFTKKYLDAAFSISGDNITNGTDGVLNYTVAYTKNLAGLTDSSNASVVTVNSEGLVTVHGPGTATIEVSVTEASNYTTPERQQVVIRIDQAEAKTITSETKEYTYSGGSHGSAVTEDVAVKLTETVQDAGTASYVAATTDSDSILSDVSINPATGILSYKVPAHKENRDYIGKTASIKVTISTANYADMTYTLTVNLTDQIGVAQKNGFEVAVSGSKELTFGQTLGTVSLNTDKAVFVEVGKDQIATDHVITGTLAWTTPDAEPEVNVTEAEWTFTPDDVSYAVLKGNLVIQVNQAQGTVANLDAPSGYQTAYTFTGKEIAAPKSTNFTTNSGSMEFTYTWYEGSVVGEHKLADGTRPLAVGNYILKVDVKETSNYTSAFTTLKVTVGSFEPNPKVEATLAATNLGTDNWYHGDVTVLAPSGYRISREQAENSFTDPGTSFVISADQNDDVTYYLMQDGTGYITKAMTITVKRDTTVPTAKITVKEKWWDSFLETVSFGIYTNKVDTVTIDAADPNGTAKSGINTVEYYISSTSYAGKGGLDNLKALGDSIWSSYSSDSKPQIAKEATSYIYARVTDKAGNTTYVSTDGIVQDMTKPELVVTPAGKEYKDQHNTADTYTGTVTVTITASDSAVENQSTLSTLKYTLDNEAETEIASGGQITITEKGRHTISAKAVDKAGNEESKAVTIYIFGSAPVVTITPEASIIYDGAVIAEGTDFTLDKGGSAGAVSYFYKVQNTADDTYISGLPTDAGYYTIKAVVAEDGTGFYQQGVTTADLTIGKAAGKAESDSRNYIYAVGSGKDAVEIPVPEKVTLPENRGTTSFALGTVTDPDNILTAGTCSVDTSTGLLSYKVAAADVVKLGKTAKIPVVITMANYQDFVYTLTITLTDKKTVALRDGSTVTVKAGEKLTYGDMLSALTFAGAEFVEAGTDTRVEGKLDWVDGSIKPAAAVKSAEWIFTPENTDTYKTVSGTTAIQVDKAAATVKNAAEDGYVTEYIYTGKEIASPADADFTTNSEPASYTFTWYKKSVAEGNKLAGTARPLEVGTYVLKVDVAENDNYTSAAADVNVEIKTFAPAVKAMLADTNVGANGWYTGDVTLLAPEGYTISREQAVESFASADSSLAIQEDQNGDFTYYLKQNGTEYITEAMKIQVKRDTELPTAGINVKETWWRSFLETVTFGLYTSELDAVTIEAEDESGTANSGIDTVEYMISSTPYVGDAGLNDLKALDDLAWSSYSNINKPKVEKNTVNYVYARVTDKAGNRSYVSTDGIIEDITAPDVVITPSGTAYDDTAHTAHTYVGTVTVKVEASDFAVAGQSSLERITYQLDEDSETSITSGSQFDITARGRHTVVAKAVDEAGHETSETLTLYIYDGEYDIAITPASSIIYDGEMLEEGNDFKLDQGESEGAVTYFYKIKGTEDSSYTAGLPVDAGSYTVKAVLAEDPEGYYPAVEQMADIIIKKATAPSITFPTAESIYSDQKLSASTLAGGSAEYGTFTWTDGSILPTVENSGYEVTFTPSEATKKNYEALEASELTAVVAVKVMKRPEKNNTKTDVAVAPAAVEEAPAGASEEVKEIVEALKSPATAPKAEGLDAAADSVIGTDETGQVTVQTGNTVVTGTQAVEALEKENIATAGKETKLVVEPYIQVKVQDIVKEGDKTVLVMDIKAMYNVKATTAASTEDMVEAGTEAAENQTVNTVTIGTGYQQEVSEPVTLSVPLPKNFVKENLFIRHTHGGTVSYYEVTVDGDMATFVNEHGFSKFELLSDTQTGTLVFDSGVADVTYNLANVGDELPVAVKDGYTFQGWNINGTTYTTFTLELLELLNGTDGKKLEVTAVFTKNSSGSSGGSSGGSGNSDSSSHASGWSNEGAKGWRYYDTNGTYARNAWRQVNENGVMVWYHFGADGYMNTGWFLDTDGSWYYLNPVSDGTKGAMKSGWLTDALDGHRYYLDPKSGKMAVGWVLIDGVWYYFNDVAPAASGWYFDQTKNLWAYDPKAQTPLGALVEGAKK